MKKQEPLTETEIGTTALKAGMILGICFDLNERAMKLLIKNGNLDPKTDLNYFQYGREMKAVLALRRKVMSHRKT